MTEQPNIINNILQVVCVSQTNNYLDWDTPIAPFLVKLLNFGGYGGIPNYIDKARTRIEYFDEKQELKIDKKNNFAANYPIICKIYFFKSIAKSKSSDFCNTFFKSIFLEEYDIQTWNQHIYNLSDISYQKKLMNQLNIPNKT